MSCASSSTVLALLTAPFVAVEQAHAQVGTCTPPTSNSTPVNHTIVTCTGATITQNRPNGWGTGVETGDTITVLAGASVDRDRRFVF